MNKETLKSIGEPTDHDKRDEHRKEEDHYRCSTGIALAEEKS
jgi:hypothetical protein